MTDLETLADLIAATTAARGVDVYAVEQCGLSASEWAERTERDRSTVARNVRRATADNAARECEDCGASFVAHWEEDRCGGCRGHSR